MYIYRELYFRELAHVIAEVRVQNPQGRPAGWRPEKGAAESQRLSADRIPLCSGEVSLCSVQGFSQLDEAHPHYGRQAASLRIH